MELFIDSVDMDVIKEAVDLGFVEGITTTPTFMHRQGIEDVDGAIVELSKLGPQLHVEALGDTVDEVIEEANRLSSLDGLGQELTFKIPVTTEGLKAASRLTDEGHNVNVHLVYTLNQIYMAAEAGATYICPLVGRLHDQGHDSFALIEQGVDLINEHDYNSKLMVSSVRHPEHVRQAALSGAHAITVPWKVLKILPENTLTDRGIRSFEQDTKLTTYTVHQFINGSNPTVSGDTPVDEAAVEMTQAGYGIVSVVNDAGELIGVLTDGDLRRAVDHEDLGSQEVSEVMTREPKTISEDTVLDQAVDFLREKELDNLIVTNGQNEPVGILDVQHLLKEGLM